MSDQPSQPHPGQPPPPSPPSPQSSQVPPGAPPGQAGLPEPPSSMPWSAAPHPYAVPSPSGAGPGRRGWLVALVVLLVLAVGGVAAVVLMSDDDGGSPGVAADLTLDDVQPMLLTEDDLGDGWVSEGSNENVGVPEEWDMSAECRRTLQEIGLDPSAAATPSVQDNFRNGPSDSGPTLGHDLSLVAADSPSLAALGDAMERCGAMSYEDDEGWLISIELRPQEADGPGDEVLAYEAELGLFDGGGAMVAATYHGYGLVTRRAGVESSLFTFGGMSDDDTSDGGLVGDDPDVDFVHDMAQVVDEKITDVVG